MQWDTNGIVHVLIINGASTCERDSYNNAPIHRAAAMGHIDIVDMLVTDFGCDPTIRGYQGRSLLHIASGSGNAKGSMNSVDWSGDWNGLWTGLLEYWTGLLEHWTGLRMRK